MAELLGLVASVIQVAGAGLKVSKELYQYADSVATADRRIKDIAKEVEITSFVIKELGNVFGQDEASAVISKDAVKTANDAMKECSEIFTEIEKTLHKSKNSKMGRLMLPFRDNRIELLRSHIDKLKAALQLLMSVLTFAHQVASRKMDRAEEMKYREEIRQLLEEKKRSSKRYEESLRNLSISDDSTQVGDEMDVDIPGESPTVPPITVQSLGSTITSEALANCVVHVRQLLEHIEILQDALACQEESNSHEEHHQNLMGSYFLARGHLDSMLGGNQSQDNNFCGYGPSKTPLLGAPVGKLDDGRDNQRFKQQTGLTMGSFGRAADSADIQQRLRAQQAQAQAQAAARAQAQAVAQAQAQLQLQHTQSDSLNFNPASALPQARVTMAIGELDRSSQQQQQQAFIPSKKSKDVGRKRALSAEQRQNAALMRVTGSCLNCKVRKQKCDPETPCRSCVEHYGNDLTNHPCRPRDVQVELPAELACEGWKDDEINSESLPFGTLPDFDLAMDFGAEGDDALQNFDFDSFLREDNSHGTIENFDFDSFLHTKDTDKNVGSSGFGFEDNLFVASADPSSGVHKQKKTKHGSGNKEPLQINVRDVHQNRFVVEVAYSGTVHSLKTKIEQAKGWNVYQQKLVYAGKILEDNKTVRSYNIKETQTVACIVNKPKITPSGAANSTPFVPPGAIPMTPEMLSTGPQGRPRHALEDYQAQLMLLESQNKHRLLIRPQGGQPTSSAPPPSLSLAMPMLSAPAGASSEAPASKESPTGNTGIEDEPQLMDSKKTYACPQEGCSFTYSRAEHLHRHLQVQHPERQQQGPYRCDFPGCGRQFSRPDLYESHKARHTSVDDPDEAQEQSADAFNHKHPTHSTAFTHDLSSASPPPVVYTSTGRISQALKGVKRGKIEQEEPRMEETCSEKVQGEDKADDEVDTLLREWTNVLG